MKHKTSILLILLLSAPFSGCSTLFPDPNTTNTVTDTPLTNTTSPPQTQTSISSAKADDIILNGAELRGQYKLSASISSTSGKHIVTTIERVFSRRSSANGSLPQILISNVTVYASTNIAQSAKIDFLESLQSQGIQIDSVEVVSGITVQRATFKGDRGQYVTLYYIQKGKTVYYIMSSSKDHYAIRSTERIFIQMVDDATD